MSKFGKLRPGDRVFDEHGHAGTVEEYPEDQLDPESDEVFVRWDWQSPASAPKLEVVAFLRYI